jgi:hypothetical protein
MSTDDRPKDDGMENLEDLMDPPVIAGRVQGRYRCVCGQLYSREIVVLACQARGHQPNPVLKDR